MILCGKAKIKSPGISFPDFMKKDMDEFDYLYGPICKKI